MISFKRSSDVARRTPKKVTGAVVTFALGALGIATIAIAPGGASATAVSGTSCAAVHVLAARASTESPGPGVITSLVSKIQSGVSASVSTSSVDYPALLYPYDTSSTAGDTAIKSELTAQVQKCPSQKIVLVGYSQGAQLVGDVLAGGGGALGLGAASAPVSSSIASHVVAVIQYGDPRHMPNTSFDKGTANGSTGLFPRTANQSLVPFASKIQSYCDSGDPFCAGGLNVFAHLDYTIKYDSSATPFVVGKLNAAGIH
ncbi:Cutinase [Frankineae bacterium MT45]|nr:Cutinase [Frankineae bacterium MT45]